MSRNTWSCLNMLGFWAALITAIASPRCAAWEQHELIELARSAVKSEVNHTKQSAVLGKSAAHPVFVTIEYRGKVLGCRGALEARSRSLEEEVVLTARAASAHDPRYRPLTPKDLSDFQVTVTVVDKIDRISDVNSLRPIDGLVLKSGGKVGVVLPLEGKDPPIRLKWAYKKAGVRPGDACELYRLKAERFRG